MWNQKLSCIPAGCEKASWRGYVESKTKLYTRGKQKSKLAWVLSSGSFPKYPREGKKQAGVGIIIRKHHGIPAGRKKASLRGYVELETKLYTRGKQKSKLAWVLSSGSFPKYPREAKKQAGMGIWN